MNKTISPLKLQLHEELLDFKKNVTIGKLYETIKVFGMVTPITVVEIDNEFFIVDGFRRWMAAQKLELKEVPIDIVTKLRGDIIINSTLSNTNEFRTARETVQTIKYLKNRLGDSQGKVRNNLSELGFNQNEFKGEVFDLIGSLLDLNCSGTQVRKYLRIDQFDNSDSNELGYSLIDKIDEGKLSVSRADNIAQRIFKEINDNNDFDKELLSPTLQKDFKIYHTDNKLAYKYIEDDSIDLVYTSPDYFGARDYRNVKKDNQIGQQTLDQYYKELVDLSLPFLNGKLKESGVFIYNVSEIIRDGESLGIPASIIIEMKKVGWRYVQTVDWIKSNPNQLSNFKGFQPSKEDILIFVKDVKKYTWRGLRSSSKEKKIKINFTNNKGVVDSPNKKLTSFLSDHVANSFFKTPVFNSSDFKSIDPNYSHQAPQNEIIPLTFILHYTKPGMTVCDLFAGSGTTGSVSLKYGRKTVNFDLDPENIEFMSKRFNHIVNSKEDLKENREIENVFFEQ